MPSKSRSYLWNSVQKFAQQTPTKVALRETARSRTYRDFTVRSQRLAAKLTELNLAPDSAIGFLGKNSIEFFESWHGANLAGHAVAPLNGRSPAAEVAATLDVANIPLIIASEEHRQVLSTTRDLTDRPFDVVYFDSSAAESKYELWTTQGSPLEHSILDGKRISLLTHTSGTTGQPKGVTFDHDAFCNSLRWAEEEPAMAWSNNDVGLMVMPNFHLAGSWVTLPALDYGGTIGILPSFDPAAALEAVRNWDVTVTCLVPTAIRALVEHSETHGAELGSLRAIFYAGSPIAPYDLKRALQTLDCQFVQFYGTSETYMISILRPEQHDPSQPKLLTSCGAPLPGVSIRVVGVDGAPLPAGEVGEVLVDSDVMFAGYKNNPEATAEALDGSWYRTGDLGYVDDVGNLHLVDRLKDMIVTGGENVYSVEVERALVSHDSVAAAAVVGTPDDRWGERIVAFVSPAAGADITERDMLSHCREQIADFKVPKEVHITEALPITPSGKIQKAVLRDQMRDNEGKNTDAQSSI